MLHHSRYRIDTKPASPPDMGYPVQFQLDESDSYVKYGHQVFAGSNQRGDLHWTAEIISQTWYQAETGKIPISGAGYGGKFSGQGFDSLWLDMSEIVRPTRDGIHGRESISTQVDIGGGLMSLNFDTRGQLTDNLPPSVQIPLPVILGPLPIPLPGRGAIIAMAEAAHHLGTLAIIAPEDYGDDLVSYRDRLAARVNLLNLDQMIDNWNPPYVEIDETLPDQVIALRKRISSLMPGAIIGARLILSKDALELIKLYTDVGFPVIHLCADEVGQDEDGRFLVDVIREIHQFLISQARRDQVTLIVSGGIAAAEHVAKSITCGADAVAIDFILQVAWGCSLWADKAKCYPENHPIDSKWGAQRLLNLLNAWRDQLLEVLGAMGMREVRRLRGEIGRTIWFNSELYNFKQLLGKSVPAAKYRRLPQPMGGEGDFRWPTGLLLATQQLAKNGEKPVPDLEYRVGASDGGFDRLAFEFELDQDPRDIPFADPALFDFSLLLNRRDPDRARIELPLPWYGAGMSYGSVGLPVMLSRVRAAQALGTLTSTGEGGYPEELAQYANHIITQVATGLFGVSEATILRAPVIEIKYAQGAKPGLGGHLLGNKNTASVARLREAVQGTSLFSPFPFHSVYSVEDHKKHLDWLKHINPRALISVKVSTPTDVDMVAVGSYYAGAHIIHLDGGYGGTGAAPEIAKKNIAMPIEFAIPKVHNFLVSEGIRNEITLMASGGLRTAYDVAKAIALGADGAILGTAELVAIGCIRIASCEKGLGCPFGITTTDPEHAKKINADVGSIQIINMYQSWLGQLAGILQNLNMHSISELRGRSDLLVYLD